jgi:MinD-like ATPase involved in chromosome partitioning or flagellar assembly
MGKIVSIHSFRGGTGKSNTTANLSAQAALAGKRVGVVDTDIQSPGIHVLFGLDENSMGRTLNDFLHGECEIKDVAYPVGEHALDNEEATGRKKLAGKNLFLIPSSIRGREISRVLREGYDVNRLNEGLQNLITDMKLDYLFIDTHPGLNEETLLSIAISDILLIILRPDNQDFQGTAVTVDIARSLDVTNLLLMVNKAVPNKYDYDDLKQQIENAYKAPLTGILPLSFDMADNASKDLFSLQFPDHDWSKELRKVAAAILEVK